MAADAHAVWSVGTLLDWTQRYLSDKSIESARLEAQILLAHVLKCSRSELYVRFDELPSDVVKSAYRDLIRRRVEGTPVAYLVGRKDFFLLSFDVTPDVLIPRPATETLVIAALERLKGVAAPAVLDMGCGSGCVGICIAHQHKTARVVAVDVSGKAIAVARRNAATHGVSERMKFHQGDLFRALNENEKFDAVVSNPPYIPTADIAKLAKEVRDHEPRAALDGGFDGFVVIDRIIADAGERLRPNGWLLLEVGAGQADAVREKMSRAELKAEPAIDDRDGILRVVIARK